MGHVCSTRQLRDAALPKPTTTMSNVVAGHVVTGSDEHGYPGDRFVSATRRDPERNPIIWIRPPCPISWLLQGTALEPRIDGEGQRITVRTECDWTDMATTMTSTPLDDDPTHFDQRLGCDCEGAHEFEARVAGVGKRLGKAEDCGDRTDCTKRGGYRPKHNRTKRRRRCRHVLPGAHEARETKSGTTTSLLGAHEAKERTTTSLPGAHAARKLTRTNTRRH